MPSKNDSQSGLSALPPAYVPQRESDSFFLDVRGLRYHVRRWRADAEAASVAGGEHLVILLHGWMDVSASFQFVVDRLPAHWTLLAPDWRGFGLSQRTPADCYWFPDYLADLERLLDALSPNVPADLVAHSMGGNVATLYAGIRPQRVRRLVNLEGVGMRESDPAQAPERYREWLDELREAPKLRDYESREAVARRLMRNNPRLAGEFAMFLAQHWSEPAPDGRFVLAGDPAHRITNPVLYRVTEASAVWREITAPVLWVLAEQTSDWHRFIHEAAYEERLRAIRSLTRETVVGAGHMLHHDQPAAVATLIQEFFA